MGPGSHMDPTGVTLHSPTWGICFQKGKCHLSSCHAFWLLTLRSHSSPHSMGHSPGPELLPQPHPPGVSPFLLLPPAPRARQRLRFPWTSACLPLDMGAGYRAGGRWPGSQPPFFGDEAVILLCEPHQVALSLWLLMQKTTHPSPAPTRLRLFGPSRQPARQYGHTHLRNSSCESKGGSNSTQRVRSRPGFKTQVS